MLTDDLLIDKNDWKGGDSQLPLIFAIDYEAISFVHRFKIKTYSFLLFVWKSLARDNRSLGNFYVFTGVISL